jgi:adenylate kinase family enzyme
MPRIVILGCAGSGKTTLARLLGERAGIPVICLDEIWHPHWQQKDVHAFRTLIEKAHASDDWISDGDFAVASFDIRLPRATLVIWIERSRPICSWRAMTRVFSRSEPHRISGLIEVLAFIWRFDQVNRPRIEAMRISHGANVPLVKLRSRGEITAFLASYGRADGNRLFVQVQGQDHS